MTRPPRYHRSPSHRPQHSFLALGPGVITLPGARSDGGLGSTPAWADANDPHAHAHVGPKLAAVAAAQHSHRLQGGGGGGGGAGHSHGTLLLHPQARGSRPVPPESPCFPALGRPPGKPRGKSRPQRSRQLRAAKPRLHGRKTPEMERPAITPGSWRERQPPPDVPLYVSQGRRLVVAHLLELGVVVHSVIIGLDLGVMQKRGDVLGLVTVLVRGACAQARANACDLRPSPR